MAIRLRDFSAVQRRLIQRSQALVERRLAKPPCPIPRDMADALRAILAAERPIVDVVYGGSGDGHGTPLARSAGYRITLYQRAFGMDPKRENRLAPLVFHELIHVARGWEFDAEAFENAWFTPAEGARPPTRDDWDLFREQHYQGWWVCVNKRTRRVTDYADRFIVAFPAKGARSRKSDDAIRSER